MLFSFILLLNFEMKKKNKQTSRIMQTTLTNLEMKRTICSYLLDVSVAKNEMLSICFFLVVNG